MNSRFVPAAAEPLPRDVADAQQTAAIVTASYAPDFERCRLLCETIDRHVANVRHHYLLVEHRDIALFRALEGRGRTVVDERDLLPRWLHPMSDPLSGFRRRVWLSRKTKPLRGWHVQQLRRIAIAAHADADALVFCDSDVAFLRPFDCRAFLRGGRVRLFRRNNALAEMPAGQQHVWSRNAGAALGIAQPEVSPHDYITTLIAWRRDATIAMCDHVEAVHGRHWVEVIASERKFSECMIYGRYADEVLGGVGHFHGAEDFCRVQWYGTPHSDAEILDFIAGMGPEQVAIGMQSFIGTDIGRLRRLIGLG